MEHNYAYLPNKYPTILSSFCYSTSTPLHFGGKYHTFTYLQLLYNFRY